MNVGIIGAGNMAQALLSPMKDFFSQSASEIKIYTPTNTRAQVLAKILNGKAVDQLEDVADCELIILAHKPQQLREVSEQLKLKPSTAIISLLASIETGQLKSTFGVDKVLRLMPNTPAQVGLGVVTCFYEQKDGAFFLPWVDSLAKSSLVHRFEEESLIDLMTPELGSGPGMVLEMIRIFSHSLEQKGMGAKEAMRLSAMVFEGSGALVKRTGETPEELRNKVTSKGGITQECIRHLSEQHLEKILHDAFKAGHNRAVELKTAK